MVICVLQITLDLFSVSSSLVSKHVLLVVYPTPNCFHEKKQCEDTPYFMFEHDIHMHVDIAIIHGLQCKAYIKHTTYSSILYLIGIGRLE